MAKQPRTAPEATTQENTNVSETTTNGNFDPATAEITVDDGAITFRWADLPEVSKFRLAKGGVSHMLGNEVASQIVNRIRKELNHSKTNPVSKDQVTAYRTSNTDQVATWTNEAVAEKVKAIREGTIADRAISTREPARSPLDRLALAKMGVALQLAIQNASAKRVAAGGAPYTPTAKDLADRVREWSGKPDIMAKYRAMAQAELDAMGAGSEEEIELPNAA